MVFLFVCFFACSGAKIRWIFPQDFQNQIWSFQNWQKMLKNLSGWNCVLNPLVLAKLWESFTIRPKAYPAVRPFSHLLGMGLANYHGPEGQQAVLYAERRSRIDKHRQDLRGSSWINSKGNPTANATERQFGQIGSSYGWTISGLYSFRLERRHYVEECFPMI